MPVGPAPSFEWSEAAIAYVVVLVVAFLVTWVVTDRLHVARGPYVAILTVVVLVLGVSYLDASGTDPADLVSRNWAWAIVAGVMAGAVVAPGVRRLPANDRRSGGALRARLAWEGVVYGFAEAVLLATLPVLAVWQMADDLGWTEPWGAAAAAGTLAIIGSLLVIAVHHLGYREFRGLDARPKLVGALVGCGVQALAFLLTGNVMAPVIAHVLLHWQLALRGVELPPEHGVVPGGAGSHAAAARAS